MYLKKYRQAISLYDKMIESNPSDAEAHVNRGIAWHYLAEKDAACEEWRIASSLGSEKAKNYLLKFCE